MGPKNLKKELDEILIVERAIDRKQKLKKGITKKTPDLKSLILFLRKSVIVILKKWTDIFKK